MAAETWSAGWWARKGGAGLLDQVLSSAAGFAVNILAARYLEPDEYGSFAVAYSVFLLAAALHTAVVTEPMMVLGPGKYRLAFGCYLRVLLRGNLAVTTCGGALMALAAGVVFSAGLAALARSLLLVAVTLPVTLLWWLARRAAYASLRPARAAAGSALGLAASVGGVLLLRRSGLLSAPAVLAVVAAANLASSALVLPSLGPARAADPAVTVRTVLADHWRFGGWNILATALYWFSGQVVLVVVPAVLGLGASAAIAAVSNLFRPLNVLVQSASLLVISSLSSLRSQQQPAGPQAKVVTLPAAAAAGAAVLYGALVTVLSRPLFSAVYAGRYAEHAGLVPLFALGHVASAVLQVLSAALKSGGDTKSVASVWAVSSILVAVLSVPALLLRGLAGIMTLVVLSYLAAAVVAWRRLYRGLPR